MVILRFSPEEVALIDESVKFFDCVDAEELLSNLLDEVLYEHDDAGKYLELDGRRTFTWKAEASELHIDIGIRKDVSIIAGATTLDLAFKAIFDQQLKNVAHNIGWKPNVGILEAECGLCHETFNPNDEADLIHAEREDGTECGGQGELRGGYVHN